MAFKDRLKQLREGKNLSMDDLVKKLSERYGLQVNKSTVSRWENGSEPKGKDVQVLAHFFDVAPSYLLDFELTEKVDNLTPVSPQTVRIPILGEIACGEPLLAEENVKGYRYESPDNLPSGNLYFLEAKGNSMEPVIPNGSHVLIREQPSVDYGEIAAVLVNGDTEATLKRVVKQGEVILLMPINRNYEPIVVTKDNPARIIGKALR